MLNLRIFLLLGVLLGSPALARAQTWANDAAAIFYKHCTSCHHTGGVAPFSLMSYADAYPMAQTVKSAVLGRRMPPWPPDVDYSALAHPRVLSAQEQSTLISWIDNGAPEGDPTQAPAPPVYNNQPAITPADLVLTIPTYTSQASNYDEYRAFTIPSGLTGVRYITGLEVIPGNPEIVHHVLVFQDPNQTVVNLDNADPLPGYSSYGGTGSNSSKLVGAWVPGSQPQFYPNGLGVKLDANTNIVLQIHYPAGAAGRKDSTQLRLKLSATPLREVTITPALNHGNTLTNGPLDIAANTTKTFNAQFRVPADLTVFSVAPHMHLIGRNIKVWGVQPNGDTLKLINIPDWNFAWQGAYNFKRALKVPRNTNVFSAALFDNTSNNPLNPNNPPQRVRSGEATDEEMMLVYFSYTLYQPGDENIIIDSSVVTSNEPLAPGTQWSIYPNPADNQVTLRGPSVDRVQYRFVDATGRTLLRGEQPLETGSATLDIANLATGLYFLEVTAPGELPWRHSLLKQ